MLSSVPSDQTKAFAVISKTITTPARVLHLSYSDEFFQSCASIIKRVGVQFIYLSLVVYHVLDIYHSLYDYYIHLKILDRLKL
jgi:hypothetical protein